MGTGRINVRPIYREGDEYSHPRMITIISASRCARLYLDDVELIEQEGRVLHIVTADRDYTVYESMETVAAMLNSNNFYRPLKSLIVNFDHVRDITDEFINFESGQSAGMGRNNISKVRNAFRKYLMNYPVFDPDGRGLRVAEDQ